MLTSDTTLDCEPFRTGPLRRCPRLRDGVRHHLLRRAVRLLGRQDRPLALRQARRERGELRKRRLVGSGEQAHVARCEYHHVMMIFFYFSSARCFSSISHGADPSIGDARVWSGAAPCMYVMGGGPALRRPRSPPRKFGGFRGGTRHNGAHYRVRPNRGMHRSVAEPRPVLTRAAIV